MLPKERLDPRAQRTKQLIEDAFLELLDEKPLHKVTVGDIAQRATINRSTFYSHFIDKHALFRHTVRQTFLQTLNEHLAQDARFSHQTLKALIVATCHYFGYLNRHCPSYDRHLRPVAETEVKAVIYEQLCTWFQERALPPATGALIATYLSWAMCGVGIDGVGTPPTQSADEMAEACFRLVVQTLVVVET